MEQSIIEKSSELFLTLGFKTVTMDDIAQEMGMSKKTLYQYFNNKYDLVYQSSRYLYHQISDGIDLVCSNSQNPIHELFEIKELVMKRLKDENASPIFQLQKFYPKIYQELTALEFQKIQTCMSQNMNKGIQMGLYREDLQQEFLIRIYFKGMLLLRDEEVFPKEQFKITVLESSFLEFFLRAITTPNGLALLNDILSKPYD